MKPSRPARHDYEYERNGTANLFMMFAPPRRLAPVKVTDLAKSELGVLSSQCLDRRMTDKQTHIEEIAAWVDDRNATHTKANWHFTTPDGRIKLKYLYPSSDAGD